MAYQPRKPISFVKFKLQPEDKSMKSVTYTIPNISCMHCVHTIKTEVGELEGVQSVEANPQTKQTTVVFDNPATEEKIVELLKEINYAPAV
jgi:copper chaperone CopZ